jgi:hypothetical protein
MPTYSVVLLYTAVTAPYFSKNSAFMYLLNEYFRSNFIDEILHRDILNIVKASR